MPIRPLYKATETKGKGKRKRNPLGLIGIMENATRDSIKQEYRQHEKDTGSVEIQVALLSQRIKSLTDHLQSHSKDHSSRRGLIAMVNNRRRLLDYLGDHDETRYKGLIQRLGLRR
jgi:small subunit ribosomal protein S15